MAAFDEMDLAARLEMEAKEYWVHLDADGSFEKYPARQHARRVQEKLGIDEGLIYLAGQPAKNNEDSDMPAPFRQRRYFYYLTGCNEASCHMTYDIQHDILSLFIPRIDPRRVIWNGRGSTLAEALGKYDVDEVYYIDELGDVIKDWSNYYGGHGSDIYILHSGQLPRIPGLHAITDSESLQPAMNAARMIKDDHEISLIRKANDISSEAHKKVLENILGFQNEAQVEGLFMDVCISRQAKQQAYDPIAASGPNAGTLHYDANNENFEDRQLMCLDAGCEYELYASDITRTLPLAKSWPSKEAENIYKLVELMQESCIERLAPGVRYLDLHILAHQIAIDGLLKLGVLHNGTREEIYAAGTSRAFFPHGLGHHVGLEVHDVGQAELMSVRRGKAVLEPVPSLFPQDFHTPIYDPALCHAPTDPRSSQLEEGMVVTVEPGIYFSNYALQQFYLPSPIHSRFINQKILQRYMPVGGVRIEDDILITSKGYENLTTAPKGDAMFDFIRGTGSILDSKKRTIPKYSTGANEAPIYRAPGCPLRTAQSGLQPMRRAATMPNQTTQQQIDRVDRQSHTLGFRRSMTTDERVQHWRRSLPPSSPQHQSHNQEKTVTMCGSSSNDVRHKFVGDSCSFPFQTQCLPPCMSCAILVQTLDRLRKNLPSSGQGIPGQIQKQQDSYSPADIVCDMPNTYGVNVPLALGQDARAAAFESKRICEVITQAGRHVRPNPTNLPGPALSKQQGRLPPASQHSPPQEKEPESLCINEGIKEPVTFSQEVPNRPLARELQKYHQATTPDHHITEPDSTFVAGTRTTNLSHTVRTQAPESSDRPVLRAEAAVAIRARRPQGQEQRRPSNHTDDRDWMA